MSKKAFYCWYLGFTEAYGLQGHHSRIYELVQNILLKHQNQTTHHNNLNTPIVKVTVKLNEDSLSINDHNSIQQEYQQKKKGFRHSISKQNYAINYNNITYVARLMNPNFSDIVVFIVRTTINLNTSLNDINNISLYHNYNNNTGKVVFNLHAFRCADDESAIKMEQYLNYYRKSYWKRYEKHKVSKNSKNNSSTKENAAASSNLHQNQKRFRSNSPSQTDHLFNNNLINNDIFLQRQQPLLLVNSHNPSSYQIPISTHRQKLIIENSSGDVTRSSASPNDEFDLSPLSDISFNSKYHNSTQKMPDSPFLSNFETNKTKLNILSSSSPVPSNIDENQLNKFDDVNKEIMDKFKSGKPLLYPPKDYNTDWKGNFFDYENRNTKNEMLLGGKLALKMRETNKKNVIDNLAETKASSGNGLYESLNDDDSFNEKANEAIKLLDDVVNSVYSEINEANKSTDDKIIYEFKPPSLGSSPSQPKIKSIQKSSKNQPTSSDLTESFFNGDMGFLKSNPLHIINEEDTGLSNMNQNKMNSYGMDALTKQRPLTSQSKNESFKQSLMSISSAANAGIRNGIFTKLGQYQPQWIEKNSSINLMNANMDNNQMMPINNKTKSNYLSTNDLYHQKDGISSKQRYSSTDNINIDANLSNFQSNRLKYSESERAINNGEKQLMKKSSCKNIKKQAGSFTKKVITLVTKRSDHAHASSIPVNSEFILKPSAAKNYVQESNETAQPTTSSSTSQSPLASQPTLAPASMDTNSKTKNFSNTNIYVPVILKSSSKYHDSKRNSYAEVNNIQTSSKTNKKLASSYYDNNFDNINASIYSSEPYLAQRIESTGFYY